MVSTASYLYSLLVFIHKHPKVMLSFDVLVQVCFTTIVLAFYASIPYVSGKHGPSSSSKAPRNPEVFSIANKVLTEF